MSQIGVFDTDDMVRVSGQPVDLDIDRIMLESSTNNLSGLWVNIILKKDRQTTVKTKNGEDYIYFSERELVKLLDEMKTFKMNKLLSSS